MLLYILRCKDGFITAQPETLFTADADVAQSVVHRIGSAGVSSSILDISTKESLENTE